uniref:Uncharacterized protein n=1 Tax=Oryza punctata TaxID=4537 RepID=A0A0E0KV57_ORYPU
MLPLVTSSLDYPCVTCLRHRRLLAFLFKNNYWDAYNEINQRTGLVFHVSDLEDLVETSQLKEARTGLVFDVSDLEDLVKTGQLKEALHYVWRFARPYESSAEAMTLMWFIDQLMVLERFAHGVYRDKKMIRGWFTRILADHPSFSMLYPLCVAIAGYFVADRAEAAKNMVDWQLVRSKAASLAGKLAPLAPEIRCMLRLPLARAKSKDMFPLIASSSFRRRRYVKAARRAPPSDLARFYLFSTTGLYADMKSLSLPGTHQDTVPRDESEKPRTGELGKVSAKE